MTYAHFHQKCVETEATINFVLQIIRFNLRRKLFSNDASPRTKLLTKYRAFVRRVTCYLTHRCGLSPSPPSLPSGKYTAQHRRHHHSTFTTHTSTQPAKGHTLNQSYSLFPPPLLHPIQSTAPHHTAADRLTG
jgi:hypothetical protein